MKALRAGRNRKLVLRAALTVTILLTVNAATSKSLAIFIEQAGPLPGEPTLSAGGSSGALKPLTRIHLLAWVAGGVYSDYLAMLVGQRGIDFDPTDNDLRGLQAAGAGNELLNAMRSARKVDGKSEEVSELVLEHIAKGAESLRKERFTAAEREFRTALGLAPEEAAIRLPLEFALLQQGKGTDAIAELREAVRLQPNEAELHQKLSILLWYLQRDTVASLAEQREAVRLEPDYSERHYNLGVDLERSGATQEAIAEYNEALRLQPDLIDAHFNIGTILERTNDVEQVIREYREEVRLHPDHDKAHYRLARALGFTKDFKGAVREMHEVVRLQPESTRMRLTLALVLALSGQPGAAVRELLSMPAVWYFLGTLISIGASVIWHRKRKRRVLSG